MTSTTLVLLCVGALFACALPLAAYILIKEKTANFHKIWDLALAGYKPARIYMVIVGLAFSLAVVAWFIAFAEHKDAKKVACAAPDHSLHPTHASCASLVG